MSLRVLVVTVVHTPLDARIHRRQIRTLLDAGHRVTFAAPFTGHGVTADEVDSRLQVIDLPRARGRRRLRALLAARRVLREQAPACDVIVLHDPELLVATVGWRGRTPLVWDVHEDLAGSFSDKAWLPTWCRRPAAALVRAGERWAEQRAVILLAEEGYRDRFSRSHVVIPNLPPLPTVTPRGPVDDRIVYVGRVSRLRGVDQLLEVARRLRPEGVATEIIGPVDADVADTVAAAVGRGEVEAAGFLPNDVALQRLDGALAGLSLLHDHPNYRHSMPTKVLEYQAWGVPVITTPLAPAREVVTRAGSGRVVPFGNVDAVVDVVLELRDNRAMARTLGAAGRADAERGRSWDGVADEFVSVVETAARTAPRSR